METQSPETILFVVLINFSAAIRTIEDKIISNVSISQQQITEISKEKLIENSRILGKKSQKITKQFRKYNKLRKV